MLLLLDAAILHEVAIDAGCWGGTGDARSFVSFFFLGGGYDGADSVGEVGDVDVAALQAQLVEGLLEAEEIVDVEAAGAAALVDVLGEDLRVLGADELVVVRGADVDESPDGLRRAGGRGAVGRHRHRRGRVEGGVVDAVAVDLADVEVVLHLGDLVGLDAVGDAPDAVGGGVVVVGELLPVGALDEGRDAARGFGGASVVLAVLGVRSIC